MALRALLSGPWREAGRFARYGGPGWAAVAPLALARAPRRLTGARGMRADWAAPALGPAAAFRLAVAARQDLWRRLRRSRGLAPIVVARVAGGRATLDLWAGALDFAPAAPQAVDALSDLFQEDRLRGWTAWAARAKPAHAER